jgi:hypothetical protein
MSEWYGVRIKKFGAGRAQFPQKMVFVTERESKEKGHKPGRYFHILTDNGGYRWFHHSRLTWKDRPPEEFLADPEVKEEPVVPEEPEPEPPEAEDQLFVSPESFNQLSEDWRQIFVEKVRGK